LAVIEEEVGQLQVAVDALEIALEEQSSRKTDLVTEAQDAAVRAAMSGSGAGAARLRNMAQTTRDRIAEFSKDFDNEASRLVQARASLEARKRAVKDQYGMTVRRLNTMSSLTARAELLSSNLVVSKKPSIPRAFSIGDRLHDRSE